MMNNIFYSSKDEIRNRILKNVRDYWGIKNMNELDPLVKLMMEALSTELFNISTDVKNMETRILDKIAGILTSDTLTSALPAHAVIHAQPTEKTEILLPSDQFYFKKKTAANDSLELFFSSLKPAKLFDAEISFIAHGNSLFRLDKEQNKLLMSHTEESRWLTEQTFYIGLKCNQTLKALDGMNFYFNFRNYVVDNSIYDLLALSRWQMSTKAVQTYVNHFQMETADFTPGPFEQQNLLNILNEDVQAVYANRFLTIDLKIDTDDFQLFPKDFEHTFPKEILDTLTVPMIWFTAKLPSGITPALMEELHVSVNAFPVVNKRNQEIRYHLSETQNIIPLKPGEAEHFLSIESLTDSKGTVYTEIPHLRHDGDDTPEGSFSMRYGSSERFDKRNVKEVVDFLFELLRDEKAAFSAYGVDFIDSALKDLEQNIASIEQRTANRTSTINELHNYVIVKPLNGSDLMYLEFWTTNAELGNQLSAGSKMYAHEHTKTIEQSLYLLSTSAGGRNRLSTKNKVKAYKYSTTTGNRIVTQSDIINFCRYELGDKITSVQVKRGIMAAKNMKEGFIRTTDIQLSPARKNELNTEEWNALLNITQAKLINRSAMNMHYRLMLI